MTDYLSRVKKGFSFPTGVD